MTTGSDLSERLPSRRSAPPREVDADPALLREFAEALVDRVRREGIQLTGSGGMLTELVREVLQPALNSSQPSISATNTATSAAAGR